MLDRFVVWLARRSVPITLTPRVVLPNNSADRWYSWHLEPALLIDWRDWWRGLYWDASEGFSYNDEGWCLDLTIYRALLPCLVLRLHFWRLVEGGRG